MSSLSVSTLDAQVDADTGIVNDELFMVKAVYLLKRALLLVLLDSLNQLVHPPHQCGTLDRELLTRTLVDPLCLKLKLYPNVSPANNGFKVRELHADQLRLRGAARRGPGENPRGAAHCRRGR